VRLVLAGHERNFQVNEVGGRTYLVSGSGAKVREEVPDGFGDAGTTAWAAQAHLLLVEVDGRDARLTPVSGLLDDGTPHLMTALSPENQVVEPPWVVHR
jgi:tartrate-resistant acid phosphatase type 5